LRAWDMNVIGDACKFKCWRASWICRITNRGHIAWTQQVVIFKNHGGKWVCVSCVGFIVL